jgi:malate dehydrogenase (oxaloacetate-decarboxylating)
VLSEFSPALTEPHGPLYPALESVREISKQVAIAVAREAQRVDLATKTSLEKLEQMIGEKMWWPHYRRMAKQ